MDSRDYAAMTGGSRKPVLSFEYEDGPWCSQCNSIVCESLGQLDNCPICKTELVWEIELPTTKEVCPLCQGEGKHVNPSIDAHGLTGNDFAEDPDFAEGYFSGTYDVSCNECHGLRVVDVANFERMAPEHRALYEQQQRSLAEMYSIEAAERRMGA